MCNLWRDFKSMFTCVNNKSACWLLLNGMFLCIYLTYNLTVVHICCFLRKNACLVRIWANWQLRSNQSDVRELVMNLCIVYFWYCGTWIGFKFEDDTNCDGEFDYYAIMYLYINWCVNACIYIRFVNFVTIFSPRKAIYRIAFDI